MATIAAPNLAPVTTSGSEIDAPKVTNTNDAPVSGGPTTPSLARGIIANTSIALSNSNLAHVCDITGDIRYSIAWVSFKISEGIQAIRTYLEGLWAGTSGSPFGDQVRAAIKYIKAKVDIIKKYIKKAQDALVAVNQFMVEMQALIAYIATLPARIASALTQCIGDATASIRDAVVNASDIVKTDPTSSANNSLVSTETSLSENESIVILPTVNTNFEKP